MQLRLQDQYLQPLRIQYLIQGHISETEVKTHFEDSLSYDPKGPQDTKLPIICLQTFMSDVKQGNG